MWVLIFLMMVVAILAGATGSDVCQVYGMTLLLLNNLSRLLSVHTSIILVMKPDDTMSGQNSAIFEKFIGQWGQSCQAFEDIIADAQQVHYSSKHSIVSLLLNSISLHVVKAINTTSDQLCASYISYCSSCGCTKGCQPCDRTSDKHLLLNTVITSLC